jgi:hypothetical protein
MPHHVTNAEGEIVSRNGVVIYARNDFVCSVCAPKSMSLEHVEATVGRMLPTGDRDTDWLKTTGHFLVVPGETGPANPHECERSSGRLHYMFACVENKGDRCE